MKHTAIKTENLYGKEYTNKGNLESNNNNYPTNMRHKKNLLTSNTNTGNTIGMARYSKNKMVLKKNNYGKPSISGVGTQFQNNKQNIHSRGMVSEQRSTNINLNHQTSRTIPQRQINNNIPRQQHSHNRHQQQRMNNTRNIGNNSSSGMYYPNNQRKNVWTNEPHPRQYMNNSNHNVEQIKQTAGTSYFSRVMLTPERQRTCIYVCFFLIAVLFSLVFYEFYCIHHLNHYHDNGMYKSGKGNNLIPYDNSYTKRSSDPQSYASLPQESISLRDFDKLLREHEHDHMDHIPQQTSSDQQQLHHHSYNATSIAKVLFDKSYITIFQFDIISHPSDGVRFPGDDTGIVGVTNLLDVSHYTFCCLSEQGQYDCDGMRMDLKHKKPTVECTLYKDHIKDHIYAELHYNNPISSTAICTLTLFQWQLGQNNGK